VARRTPSRMGTIKSFAISTPYSGFDSVMASSLHAQEVRRWSRRI
jgi:hypothetical protein